MTSSYHIGQGRSRPSYKKNGNYIPKTIKTDSQEYILIYKLASKRVISTFIQTEGDIQSPAELKKKIEK